MNTYNCFFLTHFILETLKGYWQNAGPDHAPHNVASDPGLHYFASCLAFFQQKNIIINNLTALKLKMDSSNIYDRNIYSVKPLEPLPPSTSLHSNPGP